MNYITFQKKLLDISKNKKRLEKFSWSYEDGYFYITLDRCEIYRIPSCNMILNLGMIKLADDELTMCFKDCTKWADHDLKFKEEPTFEYFKYPVTVVQIFENANIWIDLYLLNQLGGTEELLECTHARASANGGTVFFNEADEAVAVFMPYKISGEKVKIDEN